MQQRRKMRKPKIVKQNCAFCENKNDPTFRDYEILRRYISERGKIQGSQRTGVCAKHQRKLAMAIKHARHVALLPFISRA